MAKNTPLKRDPSLQPLSRDHHHGLLFSRKVRQGLKMEVEPMRIMHYAREFFSHSLEQHFEEEEHYLFPLLGLQHPKIERALREHRRLRRLFFKEEDLLKAASLIEEELEAHIRFEERELFPEIQQQVDKEKLEKLHRKLHPRDQPDPLAHWSDPFWKAG